MTETPAAAPKPALELRGITKAFQQGGHTVSVLRGAALQIHRGETIALLGPSGAGKSTLLQVAGLLDTPDSGDVIVGGYTSNGLSERERTRLRRDTLGFVYQFHHLLPEFSALENIVLPQLIGGVARRAAKERAMTLLRSLGVEHRAAHRPAQLSGGEQQRVAIARALANEPAVLLADEPTGNLDAKTAEQVFGQLQALVAGAGLAALIATHNEALAKRMNRIVRLVDGVLVQDSSTEISAGPRQRG
ncbi:MAG: ABC transporter ATP-binding protein [Proteobacteria bacterium]|nr:ABC transporter ATP-binding protein [Pseudomonadota bacterium]MDA1058565.1 ABC transporter ATP-binding protein [Pseudomonadota bacterium]